MCAVVVVAVVPHLLCRLPRRSATGLYPYKVRNNTYHRDGRPCRNGELLFIWYALMAYFCVIILTGWLFYYALQLHYRSPMRLRCICSREGPRFPLLHVSQ